MSLDCKTSDCLARISLAENSPKYAQIKKGRLHGNAVAPCFFALVQIVKITNN